MEKRDNSQDFSTTVTFKIPFYQFFNHPTTPDNLYTEGVDVVNYHNNLNYGSVATYFSDQSNGQFTPQFDIYGPVKLPHNCQYYGGNNEDNNNDERPYDMTEDALTLLADSIDDISKNLCFLMEGR